MRLAGGLKVGLKSGKKVGLEWGQDSSIEISNREKEKGGKKWEKRIGVWGLGCLLFIGS